MIVSFLRIPIEAMLLLLLPGAVLLSAAVRRGRAGIRDPLEYIFFAALLSVAFSSVAGLLLAYLGGFSVFRLAVLALLFTMALLAVRPRRPPGLTGAAVRKGEVLALLGLLALGAALFFRPVPYVFGGWDPGVYVNTAAYLAREGTLFPADRTAGDLEPEEVRRLAWRHSSGYPEKYPGFRYARGETGRLIPEFYHLFPLWLAVLSSWFGLKGIFFLTPLAGLAALAAVWLAVRELWGTRAALAAGLLLVFNVVEIWQARFPTAEMLSQFLLFAGAAAAFKYLRREEIFWAITAAAGWGLFLLCRVSSLLIWPSLAVFFYCRWWKRFRANDLFLLVPLLVFTVLSFLPQVFGDWRYFTKSAAHFRPEGTGWGPFLIAGGGGIILAAGLRLLPARLRARISRAAVRPGPRGLLLAAAAAAGVYAYFLRPGLGPPNVDRTNLVELGWLLGPFLLTASFLGILLLIREEQSPAPWLFFLIVGVPTAVFTWRQMVHFNYMWASRRFADAVIPGLIILAVYALRRLARAGRRGRFLAGASFLLLLALTIRNSAPLFLHREYRGANAFVRELAGRLDDAGLVVVEGEFVDKLPTPLDLIYGLPIIPVYPGSGDLEPIFTRLADRPGKIYWLRDNPSPPAPGGGWFLAEKMVFHSPLWERRHDRLPRRADPRARDGNFTVYIFRADPEPSAPRGRPSGS